MTVYLVWIQYDDATDPDVHSVWSTDEKATEMRNALMVRKPKPDAAWVSPREVDIPNV